MDLQISSIIAYIVGGLILLIFAKVFLFPLKLLFKLGFNTLLGGLILVLVNWLGGFLSFNISLNFISAMIVGILGVPGIILLITLKYFP